jgi:predicted ABC-type ATPase
MASPLKADICQFPLIYNEHYHYPLPQKILEKLFFGVALDPSLKLTSEESEKLRRDINDLYQKIIDSHPLQEKIAVISAGAPGAGKSIKMRQDLKEKRYAYICPDDGLKSHTRTFVNDLTKSDQSVRAIQKAYNKWLPGSYAGAHFILANLIRDNYAFYFSTTSSGPYTEQSFEFLKKQGYQIRLIYVAAPDEVRWASIQERDKAFVQKSEEKDVKEKGLLLPQRINAFLKYADIIEFHFRSEVNQSAQLAALWYRNPEGSRNLGTLRINDNEAYLKIKEIHDLATLFLNRPDLDWGVTVEQHSSRYLVD